MYITLSLPSFIIEFWFEKIGRPAYDQAGGVRRSGEDLDARGLTEWMWDVLYWNWGCVVGAALLGDWVWWGMGLTVVYSGYMAWRAYTGVRGGLGGMGIGADADGAGAGAGESKRSKKREARGGQKVVYR